MFDFLKAYLSIDNNITEDEFEIIQCKFKPVAVKKNEYLLRMGENCNYFYFVNTGCVRLYTTNEEGAELTRYLGFERKFCTALTSFIQKKPSKENIQSVVDTNVLAIYRDDFYELTATFPVMNKVYQGILEKAYITSQERIYGFQGASGMERLNELVNREGDILEKIPHVIIASYLGLTRFTLSRLIKQYKTQLNMLP